MSQADDFNFSDKESKQLSCFVSRYRELSTHRFIADVNHVIRSRSYSGQDGVIETETSGYDSAILTEFLMLFRPLISDKEGIFINKILNIIRRHAKSRSREDIIKVVDNVWGCWRKIMASHGAIRFDDQYGSYPLERMINLLLNGRICHMDEEMALILEDMPDYMRFPLYSNMQKGMRDLMRGLDNVNSLIDRMRNNPSKLLVITLNGAPVQ